MPILLLYVHKVYQCVWLRVLGIPMNGFVSAFIVRMSRLHKLVLVDTPTETQDIWNMILFLLENLQ